jgi:hypothetical protein
VTLSALKSAASAGVASLPKVNSMPAGRSTRNARSEAASTGLSGS